MRSQAHIEKQPAQEQPFRQAIHLSRHSQPQRLVIRPMEAQRETERGTFYRFRCPAPQASFCSKARPASSRSYSSILLDIHGSFLYQPHRLYGSATDEIDVSDEFVNELVHGLFEADCVPYMTQETILYMVRMLCAQMDCSHTPEPTEDLRFADWQVKEITHLMSLAIHKDTSTQDIASRCGLSVCHFSRVFKATYGLPVYQFVLQERIKRAQERLASTEDSIADIALDCGFADQSSLTRRFSAVVGLSPALWRKRSASAAPSTPSAAAMTILPQFTAYAAAL